MWQHHPTLEAADYCPLHYVASKATEKISERDENIPTKSLNRFDTWKGVPFCLTNGPA
jgi:hypothetical protein